MGKASVSYGFSSKYLLWYISQCNNDICFFYNIFQRVPCKILTTGINIWRINPQDNFCSTPLQCVCHTVKSACGRHCLITLLFVWECHTSSAGLLCACSLCTSFTVVWGHLWLILFNGTSVKVSKCRQLKSHYSRKDGWLMLIKRLDWRASIQQLPLSFLMQCVELKIEFNRPLPLRATFTAGFNAQLWLFAEIQLFCVFSVVF